MAERNPPAWVQGGSHSANNDRRALELLAAGAYGVFHLADLKVTANGTPNMTVNVAAGRALVKGTQQATQALYHVDSDSIVNKAIAAADPTNPRIDVVVARVKDAEQGVAGNVWALEVVTGTPAASPVAPSIPADSLKLAHVAVAAAASSVTSGNITDKRFTVAELAPSSYLSWVGRKASQVLNTVTTVITYDQVTDPSGMQSSAGTLTIAAPGDYLCTMNSSVSGTTTATSIEIRVNGTAIAKSYDLPPSSSPVFLSCAAEVDLVAGDVVTFVGADNSNITFAPNRASCRWVRPPVSGNAPTGLAAGLV